MAEPGPLDRPPASTSGLPAPADDDAASVTHGFLFADLRDYTGYVEARGNRAGAALLARYRALVREAVASFHGAEIRTEGDSFYVVFGSVSAAVRCGLAILTAAAATATEPDPIRVGVGVHAGETVETAEGLVGSAVNVAARLCAEAKAGELVVSDTVRALTRTSLDVAFEPLGLRRLKGVPEPVACYRVLAPGAAVRAAQPAGGRRPSRLLAAGLAIVIVALVAVGAAVLLRGGPAAVPSPGPSAAAVASPSAAPAAGASAVGPSQPSVSPTSSPTLGPFPNAGEAAILAALPSAVAETCRRGGTSDDARLAGFVGSIHCATCTADSEWQEVNPGVPRGGVTCLPTTGAARFYVMDFSGKGGGWVTDGSLGHLEAMYRIPYGSCATQARAYEPWTGPSGSGMLACMNPSPYDGRPWIYFTFGNGKYLGFATRDDSDYAALYQWWDQLKTFLP
jgi:class 3 adenylate cyclase